MFRPGLAQKPRLWLGPRGLWLSQTPGRAKAIVRGLALAWPGFRPGLFQSRRPGSSRSLAAFKAALRGHVAVTTSASMAAVMVAKTVSAVMPSTSDLLFRALHHVLRVAPRVSVPPWRPSWRQWRAAAFARRLLSAALHWPAHLRCALEFVKLVTHEPLKPCFQQKTGLLTACTGLMLRICNLATRSLRARTTCICFRRHTGTRRSLRRRQILRTTHARRT